MTYRCDAPRLDLNRKMCKWRNGGGEHAVGSLSLRTRPHELQFCAKSTMLSHWGGETMTLHQSDDSFRVAQALIRLGHTFTLDFESIDTWQSTQHPVKVAADVHVLAILSKSTNEQIQGMVFRSHTRNQRTQ